MSNAKWKIVPVNLLTQCPRSSSGWNSALDMIASAPEPDWEALADAVFAAEAEAFAECVADGTVMQHGQRYARRISILAALKATFGSKP